MAIHAYPDIRFISTLITLAVLFLPSCKGRTEPDFPPEAPKLTDFSEFCEGDDWAPALLEALKDNDEIIIPKGRYTMGSVRVPSGKIITGEGTGTVLVPTRGVLFRVEGTEEEEIPLMSDMADFSAMISLSKSGDIAAGDLILLTSQRNCMFKEDCGDWTLGQTTSKNRTCFFGEFLTVGYVDGNNLVTSTPAVFPGYSANDEHETVKDGFATRKSSGVRKIIPVEDVTIRDIHIENNGKCLEVVRFKYADNCRAIRVSVKSNEDYESSPTLFKTNLARNCHFISCSSTYSEALFAKLASLDRVYENYSYYNNFRLISSQDCSLEDCEDDCATHAFSITYGNGSIPSVRCSVKSCRSRNSIWAGVVAQQCTPWSILEDNSVINSSQGVFAGSLFAVVRGNTVSTNLPYSTNHYYAHISRGGTTGIAVFEGYARGCEISGNSITGFRTGISIMDGYEQNNIFDGPVSMRVTGNEVFDCLTGLKVVRNNYNNSNSDLDVTITGNNFRAASNTDSPTVGFDMAGASGITLSDNTVTGFSSLFPTPQ